MSEAIASDVVRVLSGEGVEWEAVEELISGALTDRDVRRQLQEAASELRASVEADEADEDMLVVFGIVRYALGALGEARDALSKGRKTRIALYALGKTLRALGDYRGALSAFGRVVTMSPKPFPEAKKDAIEARCLVGDVENVEEQIDELAGECRRGDPDVRYLRGLLAEKQGAYEDATDLYRKVLKSRSTHMRARFRLAFCQDLCGDDDGAMANYAKCAEGAHPHVGALVNLGVMHDDRGEYDEAIACFNKVLKQDPTNPRAILFLRDARASKVMYYDEELEKKTDRRNRILEIPITDFELSVRSRNCLERIGIKDLGDLTMVTENQLLAHKNFGETSLAEIKQMLSQKGLWIGQALDEPPDGVIPSVLPEEDAPAASVLERDLDEIDLSVRARRCMEFLGIGTLGELVRLTPSKLLACKNFGETSLDEVAKKLAALGLSLTIPEEEEE